MATVAKGTKKPSHGSNISLTTTEVFNERSSVGLEKDCGVPVTMETKFVAKATKKREFCESFQVLKSKAMSIRVQCWFRQG